MTTLHEAQVDYLNRWKKNSEQHFNAGDYDWVANLVEKSGARSILEIGCGVGYSTLALANRGIRVRAIDSISEAIESTKSLLTQFGFCVDASEEDKPPIYLNQADVIVNFHEISSSISSIDTILICNPGGKLETELTQKEIDMLRWGKCSDRQIAEDNVFMLHKWAMILAAARLAKENKKSLIVVDRGCIEEIDLILHIIEISADIHGIGRTNRAIQVPPADGIGLGDCGSSTNLFWVAGLYEP